MTPISPRLYASTDDGTPWPVIDITDPAFAFAPSDQEMRESEGRFRQEAARRARIWRPLHRLMVRALLRGSLLGPGLLAAAGGFITGLNTYLLKLGPENLPEGATAIDRRIADSYPARSTRLRLQDMAHLLADSLTRRVSPADGRPICLVNIAGGPAADSLNALILLHGTRPDLTAGRRIEITILDQDDRGPAFGMRCATALMSQHGPLAGVDLHVKHLRYDWRQPSDLARHLADIRAANAHAAVSSEGGLFEYGLDDEIVANLRTVAESAPPQTVVVGSVTRGDGAAPMAQAATSVKVQPRTREAFAALAERGGWMVDDVIERPFSYDVRLAPKAR